MWRGSEGHFSNLQLAMNNWWHSYHKWHPPMKQNYSWCQCFHSAILWSHTLPTQLSNSLQSDHTLKKKGTSEHIFWCSRLSQIEGSIQYVVGPNSTWMDHDRNLGVQIMIRPATIWSFHVLNRVLYLWQLGAPKKVLWSTFFLRVYTLLVLKQSTL